MLSFSVATATGGGAEARLLPSTCSLTRLHCSCCARALQLSRYHPGRFVWDDEEDPAAESLQRAYRSERDAMLAMEA